MVITSPMFRSWEQTSFKDRKNAKQDLNLSTINSTENYLAYVIFKIFIFSPKNFYWPFFRKKIFFIFWQNDILINLRV